MIAFTNARGVKSLIISVVKLQNPARISNYSNEDLFDQKGVLFDMGREVEAVFWMKETSFPLSAAFLDRKGKVLAVYNMKPFAEIQARPPFKFRYVFEANSQWFSSNGVEEGSRAILPATP